MVGRQHRLDGLEFEQAPGIDNGQGGLACCCPWVCKESDTTEQLNWTEHSLPKWFLSEQIYDIRQIFFLSSFAVSMHISCFSPVQLFVTLWTVAHQAPLPMGFSRQEYWVGLPFPSSENLPDPGIEQTSPALAGRFFTTEPLAKPSGLPSVPNWGICI